jgi:uncharacterized membrane protein YbhN (UPF0104 family)
MLDEDTMTDTSAEITDPPAAGGFPWKRVVQGVVSLAIVAGIFVGVMPQIAGYGDVWATIRALTWREAASLLVLALWNLATYWFVMVAALPGLRLREAAVVNQASTAVANTLPGGGAIGVGVTVAMLTSWGFTIAAITRSTLVSGIWNNFVKLGMPVVALALLALEGGITPARIAAAAVGIGVLVASIVAFALVLRSERLARRIGDGIGAAVSWARRLVGKAPLVGLGDRAAAFRADTVGFVQHRWVALTVTSVISHFSLYVVLLVTLRHVGVSEAEVSWIQVLAAFSFVRLISALPITPGGVGVVELGYAAALTIGLDEMTKAQIVAAILVFRAITYLVPVPLGAASYVVWRGNRSWRLTEGERDELAGDAYQVASG